VPFVVSAGPVLHTVHEHKELFEGSRP
jgi:hypothetical protein